MESSVAGGEPRPSLSDGASPPPPPLGGSLAGLVSCAGRLLAAVLGPDSSQSGYGSTAAAASDGASPSASSSPDSSRSRGCNGDHGDSQLFPPKNNQLIQSGKDTVLKDYVENSLAIVSDIEPKDAIMQLLMQETYSRSECSTLIKIIQERVVNSDSGGIVDGTAPTLTPADRGFFNHNADKIQSVFKRSYSVAGHTPEDLRRVRPKISGNLLNISKFKQVNVISNRPVASSHEKLNANNHNAFEGFSGDNNKLLSDVPLSGTNNLAYSNIISKVESAEEILDVPNKPSAVPSQRFDSNSSPAGGDQKNYDSSFFNSYSNKDLKNGFPLKVEPLDVFVPFEQKMVDLSHQKHEDAASDDSCSVSKLMFMEDIEAAPSLPMGVQLQNGSKNRRRKQSNCERTTPNTTGSPAKGTRRKNNDFTVRSETDLLEQSTLALMEQDPDYVPEKRPVGRPRKGR